MKKNFEKFAHLVFDIKEGETVSLGQTAGLVVVLVLIVAIMTVVRI